MESWFYVKNGQQCGPVVKETLVEMFSQGALSADTMVWTKSLKEWTLARDMEAFDELFPPPISSTAEYLPSGSQIRPWVRFWARTMIDMFLFAVLVRFIFGGVFLIIAPFAYIFVEAIMLSSWGTTPGKALLRVRLRRHDGTKLTFSEALNRAFRVWLRGEGLNIPIVNLVTGVMAYKRLRRESKTSWDQDGDFLYSHEVIGWLRVVLTVLVVSGLSVLWRRMSH